eukprot:7974379-Pyramimonas_sp.AAC.1
MFASPSGLRTRSGRLDTVTPEKPSLCRAPQGTQHHRFCPCPALEDARKEAAEEFPAIARRARTSGVSSPLFARGWTPHQIEDLF